MLVSNKTQVSAARKLSPEDKLDGIKAALKTNISAEHALIQQVIDCREELDHKRKAKAILEGNLQDCRYKLRRGHHTLHSGTTATSEDDSEDSSSSSDSSESDCQSPATSSDDLPPYYSPSKDLVELGPPLTHDPIRKRKREPEGRLPTGRCQPQILPPPTEKRKASSPR
jgi:hypothetical protein